MVPAGGSGRNRIGSFSEGEPAFNGSSGETLHEMDLPGREEVHWVGFIAGLDGIDSWVSRLWIDGWAGWHCCDCWLALWGMAGGMGLRDRTIQPDEVSITRCPAC